MRRLMWCTWLVLAISGAAVTAAGCQEADILPAPVAAQSAPIVNGMEDDGDPAVVMIQWSIGNFIYTCTGTLVAPRVVLTARHCVRDEETAGTPPYPPGIHKVSFHSGGATDSHVFVATTGYDTLPGPQNDWGNDVALIYLAEDAPANIKPIPISTYTGAIHVSQALRVVGFGETNANANDQDLRRVGTTSISFLDEQTMHHILSPSGTCEGDSGGPQLVKLGDVEAVAAVTSNGEVTCQGDHGAVRTDAHVAFFQQHFDTQFDKSAPVVTVTSPANGADVAPGFEITADMTDDHGMLGAALVVDGTPAGSDPAAPWVLKAPSNLVVGSHTIDVVGTDVFGNTTKKTITVNVKPGCTSADECADGQECANGICGSAIGADCQSPSECTSGQCYHTTDSSFCTINCASASECPSGFTCAASGVSPVTKCIAEESSGCAIGAPGARGSRAPFVAAMLMFGLLLGLRLRRRD
jgi:hypothetical protein